MNTKPISIRIENPCQQDWHSMPISSSGRHCQKCSKHIIDFSLLADAELHKILKDGNTHCGRFENSQLNRSLRPYPEASGLTKAWSLLAGVFLLSGTAVMRAQDKKALPVTEIREDSLRVDSKPNQNPVVNDNSVPPGRFSIRGVLMDSSSREPIPFAIVVAENSKTGSNTDINGAFQIVMPEDFKGESILLRVSYVGYRSKITKVNRSESAKPIVIFLSEQLNTMTVGAIIIQEPKWWQFRKRYRYTHPR
jgi:hypothetical protein